MSTQKTLFLIWKPLAQSLVLMLVLALPLSIAAPAMARGGVSPSTVDLPVSPRAAEGPTDPAEMEAFLGDYFAKAMQENHIAGAAIAVVKDGRIFFTRGYGYADLAEGIPVDPERTIFHVGSVGKLFTWTAVMQLAEQGKVDLDADINTYLDFRIPDTYPQPISLKHLMTHTSGFEDRWLNSIVSNDNPAVPAREWLLSYMPARVRPPGEAAGYSNFDAMFAGYIVERVSGQPYAQYIQEHIFDPLGMRNSSARSPIPADLRPQVSVGYKYINGAFQPVPEYTAEPALLPSGGQAASVTDMARFMIAHLQDGFYSDGSIATARILEAVTAQKMRSTAYTPDPRLRGSAYGFSDLTDNGQWTLGHEGYFPPTHTQLLLLPDQHLGIYVAYNSADAGILTKQHIGFQRAFFDHYYPAPEAPALQPAADFAGRASRFAGLYEESSAPATTFHKVRGLVGQGLYEVRDAGDGTLLLVIGPFEWRFTEVEPLYFRQVDGPFAMIFREDSRGRITQMYTDLMPQYTVIKLNWYETPAFNMVLLLGCILVFLSMLPVAVVRWIRGRRNRSPEPAAQGARLANWTVLAVSALNLLFVAGLVPAFNPPSELHAPQLFVKIMFGVGVLSAILTAAALVSTVLAWKNKYWGLGSRLYYTLVVIAALGYVWFLNNWNLLGWRY